MIFSFCWIFFSGFTPVMQDAAPTFDPFASGSFYAERTPEPTAPVHGNGRDTAEMIYIPEGPFLMGSDASNALTSSRPTHEVYLDGYWIDKYEVSNRQFTECVRLGYCFAPRDLTSATHEDYFTSEAYADYPVVHVDWNQAAAYCTWVGKRLPTEAEWEKAARGTNGLIYPWGNVLPKSVPAQIGLFEEGDTAPVNSFPDGASPYGVFNMEGNVWEWTADQYDAYYYSKSPETNPKSVTGGNDYVIRGFSWAYPFSTLEIFTRNSAYMLNHAYDLGFRCAASGQ